METINSTTVRVDDFSDLSSILTTNSDITYVYLANDINMTSGIRLHNDRKLIIIDGEYPPGSGTIHTLTDYRDDFGMIYKSNISPLDITFQNIIIKGQSFYGMPRIADGNTNVAVTFRNVTYTGPQTIYHFAGLTRYIDCDITIEYAGYQVMNEVGEVCQVEIGGNTIMRHNNTGYAVFYFYKANASLTILEDANVEITTNYDFLYHEFPPKFTIQPRANFTLTTARGISRNSGFRFSSFVVDTNAMFKYIQLSNSEGLASLYIDGDFTVNSGATVYMQADFTSSSNSRRLVQFSTIASASKGLYVNDPKRFVLYNKGPGTAIYFGRQAPFTLAGDQVNYWRDAADLSIAGTFDDMPLHQWRKLDWSGFNMKGTATTGSTTVNSTTLPEPVTPDTTNLKLQEARVLSVGTLPITLNTIVDDGTPISGQTEPGANIKIEYTDNGTYTLTGTADGSGKFSIATPSPITIDTPVKVSANLGFLYVDITKKVVFAGILHIESAPILIQFDVPALSPVPQCILGRKTNVPVVIVDTRAIESKWELLVSIDAPMICQETSRTLPGDVVFVSAVNAFDTDEPIKPNVFTRVYVGGPGVVRTKVVWENRMGILLRLTGAIYIGDKYNAHLIWQVRPIQP